MALQKDFGFRDSHKNTIINIVTTKKIKNNDLEEQCSD